MNPTSFSGRPVVLIAAVRQELEPLAALLRDPRHREVGRKAARLGTLDGVPVILMAAGMGKTNAAHGLTALLETHVIRGVLNLGVGGAYPGCGLRVGDIALATEEVYGDEGVEAPQGWLSTEEIGIPLLHTPAGPCFNRFPLHAPRVEAARQHLEDRGFDVVAGPFVTVSCCSGTARRGRGIATRFGAVCESMEGAALAHVTTLYEVPFLALRGISNLVEDRDLGRWRLHDAIEAACRAARALMPVLGGDAAGSFNP
jgi:futalosine hydrolase